MALAVLAAFVLFSGAATTVRADSATNHYDIAIWNVLTHDYPVTGTMDLTYHGDGTVRGYYHPAGLPSFVPITGGRQGDHIWLTIGTQGRWTLDGNFRDGKITGSANNGGMTPYSFVATPR
jgi:hypothetical protein